MRFLPVIFILFLYGAAQAEEFSPLVITTSTTEKIIFSVELADNEERRAKGLMFREKLADNHGMLFVFKKQKILRMWMKNTLLPLDMLFIRSDGVIVKIARETEPRSLDIISSGVPVQAVLEINAKMSDLLGIAEGDTVYHEAL